MFRSVVTKFEEIAAEFADEYALHTKSEGLVTYRELNASANGVANALLALMGPGNDPVLLFYRHGERAQIDAILGVLKAGKIVVSVNVERQTKEWCQRGFLDHGFMDRSGVQELLWMSLGAKLILCDHRYSRIAREIAHGVHVLNTELDINGKEDNPQLEIKPQDLLSILHTSGTSGEPKAIKRPHSMELYNMAIANEPKVGPGDRVTLFRTGNVAAMADMFLALLNGARLCPYDVSAGDLTEWVIRQKITYFRGLGSAFRKLDYERGEGFPNIKLINVGGEPITIQDFENYRRYFSDSCKFVVRYSSSETGHICHNVLDKQARLDGTVPVGYPLGERRIKILDTDSEIAVEDKPEHLFAGYLNNPALTAEKLMGGFYRTGDRGYIDSAGALVHLGRIQKGGLHEPTA